MSGRAFVGEGLCPEGLISSNRRRQLLLKVGEVGEKNKKVGKKV